LYSFVFDPGLEASPGRLLVQSLWVRVSRHPLEDFAQKQAARENPRRIARTYSGSKYRVKANGVEKPRKTAKTGEWRVANGEW
jgi:hypothetical protein